MVGSTVTSRQTWSWKNSGDFYIRTSGKRKGGGKEGRGSRREEPSGYGPFLSLVAPC